VAGSHQEVTAGLLQLHEAHGATHIGVGQVVELPHAAPELDIRDGLNIKGKTMH
jgi:hypothetical protein